MATHAPGGAGVFGGADEEPPLRRTQLDIGSDQDRILWG